MNNVQHDFLLLELFKHATESIIVTDANGYIIMVNPATEKLFEYSFEELSGKKVEFLLPKKVSSKHVEHRETYATNPHARSMGIGLDLFAIKKSGLEFPVEVSLSPFDSDGNKFVIGFVIDITKRKLVESAVVQHQKDLESLALELKTSNEKLETKVLDRTKVLREALTEIEKSRVELSEALEKEKELNELKSRFLSMASHEFRTPLTTILSSASLIPEYPMSDQQEKRLKHVDRIKSAVNNLNDILSDFLSLSKIEEGKVFTEFKKLNLQTIATEICNEMHSVIKPGQEILYTHTGTNEVTLDQKLIRNIIINLVSNAIKFSDENKAIKIATIVTDKLATITVADQGIGISDDDKKHLFQRFFRGQNATNVQGTGLGLNIVANYVELMNGFIEIESELDKGTHVKITFPIK